MEKRIAIVRGDYIGPEIVGEAIKVLRSIEAKYHHTFIYDEVLAGGAAIDATGECLPQVSIVALKQADAVLLGAVGGPKYDSQPANNRPEKALLRIRSLLGLFANLRPAILFPQLADASPLKPEIVQKGIDFVVVRELTGGIYFGKHETIGDLAVDEMAYSVEEIQRIAKVAFETAQVRHHKVTCVDKANVLDTSKLWRKVVKDLAKEYPDVELNFMYVDNAAMQLCKDPSQFDVILTENMFGDILSDEASMLTGTIGTIGSASLGSTSVGMYEPIHGSAPDIAGKDMANPLGTILSVAMMMRYSFHLEKEAQDIEKAVNTILDEGYRTADMMSEGMKQVGCQEMGDLVVKQIENY
ncbi:MAG: 3-isopropylmalate dehydrogenase [Absicoccus porci]|uniref:3-isopropylmalate dehydrogenase n=1 Tax=Absicoccus porci TaxID=2486576 RepID=A0A3N0I3E5_9FIRM|nr:3-isopropylmalate dehydrogenase [Absicoccus porci]MCI6087295.1 3-isopropylmalate dehydrogenase [Absicoccus porci]MDD7329753.1 3-isopropylmalate dehydrogenase [Absicoccus porci]MDY4738430.1 3-isopropylmalate dehydrogenase [Absicoccus porci]RNM31541.1 3-isopropylmalate dehydrogenase [Absicoccus porci]